MEFVFGPDQNFWDTILSFCIEPYFIMNCNAFSLGITSLILMTVSKDYALLEKIFEDWFMLPERQELFEGLLWEMGKWGKLK